MTEEGAARLKPGANSERLSLADYVSSWIFMKGKGEFNSNYCCKLPSTGKMAE